MVQDILTELLQTEKDAAGLVAQAEKAAARKAKETEQKIQQIQLEWKQELKQKRLALQAELEAGYAKEAAQARKKTAVKLEKIKAENSALSAAAEHLMRKILA